MKSSFDAKVQNFGKNLQNQISSDVQQVEINVAIQEIESSIEKWPWEEVKSHICCVPVGEMPNQVVLFYFVL